MKLDVTAIEHLATLARLRLDHGEAEIYGHQLTEVLNHVDNLQEASEFIQKNKLIDLIEQQQVSVAPVELAQDQALTWPTAEVSASLAMSDRRVDGEIIVPRI